MTRIEAIAKAREARAAKKLEREQNPPEATQNEQNTDIVLDSIDLKDAIAEANLDGLKTSLWREAMVAQMHNGRLLHQAQLESCGKFADQYVAFAIGKLV